MFVKTNPNPVNNVTGDCVIRAISIAEDKTWDEIFLDLMVECFFLKDVPSSNPAWGEYLRELGYQRHLVSDLCPYCYNVEDFARENPEGTYILATGTHVVCVKSGRYMDSWDSGQERPIYYFKKGE